MSLQIKDTSCVPSEGWQYPHPAGGLITGRNYATFYGIVIETYQANEKPVPSLQTVTDWQCDQLSIPCFDSETREPLINKFALGLPSAAPSGCCGK